MLPYIKKWFHTVEFANFKWQRMKNIRIVIIRQPEQRCQERKSLRIPAWNTIKSMTKTMNQCNRDWIIRQLWLSAHDLWEQKHKNTGHIHCYTCCYKVIPGMTLWFLVSWYYILSLAGHILHCYKLFMLTCSFSSFFFSWLLGYPLNSTISS